jgi:hypothetical protein
MLITSGMFILVVSPSVFIKPVMAGNVGYFFILYITYFHKESQLPYIGGHFCIVLSILEILFIDCDVRPTNDSVDPFAIVSPLI